MLSVNLRSIGRCFQCLEGSRKVERDGLEFAAVKAANGLQRHGQRLPLGSPGDLAAVQDYSASVFFLQGQANTTHEFQAGGMHG